MEKYNIQIQSKDAENQCGIIKIEGDLGISNIGNIKIDLLKAISNYNEIDLKVEKIKFIDLSMIQFLISLKKSESILNKKIQIDIIAEDEFRELIISTGFKLKY
ncbi:MAG: hypothetical protein AUJ98_06320 [Bacteroidetes bacterium CG2_30_33_31]|nr:MAG: hypothetical protein AUJ98_06320 [Bacteroidetes bacterium CG2_30_33_31]